MTNGASLCVHNLNAFYGNRHVLCGVSFEAHRGGITALLGANGSGKSTLLRLLAGLRHPQLQYSGVIQLEGIDIAQLKRKAAARAIAYTAQNETSAWPYSVREAVLMGRFSHTEWNYSLHDKEVAAQKITLMELDDLAERSVMALSGGEFQRVILARALAQEAPLLLLDEPVSNLDIRYQQQLMRITRSIVHSGGLSAVISLHDINLAALFADQIVCLRGGKVIASGCPADIMRPEILGETYGIRFGFYHHPQKNILQAYVDEP